MTISHSLGHNFGNHFGDRSGDQSHGRKVGHWLNDKHDKHDAHDAPSHDAQPEPTTPAPTTPVPDHPDTPAPTPVPEAASGQTELENALLKLINTDRTKVGAHALTTDSELADAAHAHSAWMDKTDTFSHTGVNGSSPTDRIEDAGYGAVRTAENIAYIGGSRADVLDFSDVQQLHTNLMNSPGHYANLMNPALTEVGLGLHQGDIKGMSAIFVTEDFGTPNAAEDAIALTGIPHAAETHYT